jgi:mRNA interferase HigB
LFPCGGKAGRGSEVRGEFVAHSALDTWAASGIRISLSKGVGSDDDDGTGVIHVDGCGAIVHQIIERMEIPSESWLPALSARTSTGPTARFFLKLLAEVSRNAIICLMHVISKKALTDFGHKHPRAREPMLVWHQLVITSNFQSLSEVKKTFNTADYVDPYTVFDIAGNHFRIITVIHYNRQKMYIREVFTHADYDHWNKAQRSRKT